MSRTLYVSDLDETLLRTNETLSPFTVNTINALVESGMIFSYATARSYHTASQVTKGLSQNLPVIVYNGTFILENGTQKELLSNQFENYELKKLLDTLIQNRVFPLVYSHLGERERYSYVSNQISRGIQKHLDRRVGDPRQNPVNDPTALYKGNVFCITCMDEADKLHPLYEKLKNSFQCMYFRDVYTQEQWLEIHPSQATKANAIVALKDQLSCDRIVCFGNGKNDISMFQIADECYAVGNAVDELKGIATDVIDTNDRDGVAKWLLEHYHP